MKLKLCWICGDSPQVLRWASYGGHYEIRCIGVPDGCRASTGRWRLRDTAERKWNEIRRVRITEAPKKRRSKKP